ncbi:hypothetical protein D3C87_2190220 [compost metagenome]
MRSFKMSDSGRIALVEEPTPKPGVGQVLMRVRASSLNARDLFMLRPLPGAARSRAPI